MLSGPGGRWALGTGRVAGVDSGKESHMVRGQTQNSAPLSVTPFTGTDWT